MFGESPQKEFNMFPPPDSSRLNDEARDGVNEAFIDDNGGFIPPLEPLIIRESSSGGEGHHDARGQKRRAETWGKEEKHCLINLRREFHVLFNSCKSNKHLWEQISARMREMWWERTAPMCTDKWRNLLKEFKKAKNRSGAMPFTSLSEYDEIQEYFTEKKRNFGTENRRVGDSHFHFSDIDIDEASFSFEPVEDYGRSPLNNERSLDSDEHPLGVREAEAGMGVPTWNRRGNHKSGGENESTYTPSGRVISVKFGECTKRIDIDGTCEAIKEAIKSAFGLRTKRAFWLEDEDGIVRALDRKMPLRNYTLHLDEGLTIKVCLSDGTNHRPCHVVEITFYTEDDFSSFLRRNGWVGIKRLRCNIHVATLDDLESNEVYHGQRLVTN